jgi:hypothetical protein
VGGQAILQQSCWVVEVALSARKPSSSLASLSGLQLSGRTSGAPPCPPEGQRNQPGTQDFPWWAAAGTHPFQAKWLFHTTS